MSRRSYTICALMILGMLLFSTGCCLPSKGPPLGDPVPIGEGIAADVTTEDVSQRINARSEQFQTLKGLGKVGIQNWEERYRFSQVFVLEKPGRFRLETLGAFDQPAVFLTSNNTVLSLYTKKHNKLYKGLATQENLFRLSGLNLSVEDAILVLSGNVPRLSTITSEWGMPLDVENYYLERTSLNDEIVQRIWYDTTIQAVSKVQEYMLANGILVLDIDFKKYIMTEEGYSLPTYILIDRPFDNIRVEIEYSSLFNINQSIDQTLFTFIPPVGAEEHILENVYEKEVEPLVPYEEFRVSN